MRLFELRAVYAKELRSLLRDRHILIYSVALPAFLYPAVLLGVLQVVGYVRGVEDRRASRVELEDDVTDGRLRAALVGDDRNVEISDAAPGIAYDRDVATERLRDDAPSFALDAIVVARPGDSAEPGSASVAIEVYFDAARDASSKARERVGEALVELREAMLRAEAEKLGATEAFLDPLVIEEVSLSTREEFANHIAALVLPLLMILMTALGAFYPALDAAVGEKERGTLETTLVSPVARLSIVTGKYLAVSTVSLLSFALNLGGMYVTFTHFQAQLQVDGFSITWSALLVILAAAVLLAGFFSAIMMLLAFLARSFKEGQSYVTPIYLVSLLPIVVTTNPEIGLTPTLSLVPLINTALLFRDALENRLDALCVTLTFASSALLAIGALLLAARVVGRESVAVGGDVPLRRAIASAFGRRTRAKEEVPS